MLVVADKAPARGKQVAGKLGILGEIGRKHPPGLKLTLFRWLYAGGIPISDKISGSGQRSGAQKAIASGLRPSAWNTDRTSTTRSMSALGCSRQPAIADRQLYIAISVEAGLPELRLFLGAFIAIRKTRRSAVTCIQVGHPSHRCALEIRRKAVHPAMNAKLSEKPTIETWRHRGITSRTKPAGNHGPFTGVGAPRRPDFQRLHWKDMLIPASQENASCRCDDLPLSKRASQIDCE
jgi:hypothetical protein